jgi:hypothetical protein
MSKTPYATATALAVARVTAETAVHSAGLSPFEPMPGKSSLGARIGCGHVPRPDLDRHAYEHHWQRPDGTTYLVRLNRNARSCPDVGAGESKE